MKWLFLLWSAFLFAQPCLVFVHIGPKLPDYLETAVTQARMFNPEIPIYVVACKAALHDSSEILKAARPALVDYETLPRSSLHEKFLKTSKIHKAHGGFWINTSLRFFYLADLVQHYKLGDVFHLENDIMLYVDLETLLPVFQKHYSRMLGVTYDNDERGIAGLVYIPHLLPLNHFLEVVIEGSQKKEANDMIFLQHFREKHLKQYVDALPIIMPDYGVEHALVSRCGFKGTRSLEFVNHVEDFGSLFDAAALGQYLGGIDSKEGNRQIGYISDRCIFNPALLQFEWRKDALGRRVPFAIYKDKSWRINNLHIHSKQLKEFLSQ